MSQQANLGEYADEYGTTDNIREGVELNPPEDGHLRRVNRIHDYWHGLESFADGCYNSQSLVPPGKFSIVIDPETVERGWPSEHDLESGVWLSAREEIGSVKPPTPIAVDDRYLKFAAEACIMAAREVVDERVVGLTTSLHETLSIGVGGEDYDYQEQVFDGGSIAGMPPEGDAETRCGFFRIRKMGTPFEVYTDAEVPRLSLEELRVDIPEGWSP
ncbi:hypothetical protein [Natrinema ejinorense]|uniref:Uncharacterized protein n=1 Tax=Natrinema ejinorense TaxID=373386 RepID=A0A2A5QP47_9EURY|nr:hypothetical protein [Natrinema ejinorense]PCR88621.1 hypothetical protein CP557_21540 [Natrinema ejinorense]